MRPSLAGLLLAGSGLHLFSGADARSCPPLGAVLPAPKKPSSHPAVKAAIQQFMDAMTAEATTFNRSAASISVKSIHECKPMIDFHHTPEIRDERGTKKVDASTVYRMASVTKLFTVLAALQRSDIIMSEPVTKYLPELLNGPKDEVEFMNWDEVSVAAAASHLGGIGADMFLDIAAFAGSWESIGLPPVTDEPTCSGFYGSKQPCTREEFIDVFKNKRAPIYPSNTSPVYSNAGTTLVGLVVEAAAGKALRDIFQESIFNPVGMTSTTYARPPTDLETLFIVDGDIYWDQKFGVFEPAGGIYSSTSDMIKFGQAILEHKLMSPMKSRDWLRPASFTSNGANFVGSPWEIYRSDSLTKDGHIIDVYTKGGDIITYHANLIVIPEYDIVISILGAGPSAELQASGWSFYELKLSEILKGLIPALEEAARAEASVQFVGTYTDEESNSTLTLSLDDGPGLVLSQWFMRGFEILPNLPRFSPLAANITSIPPQDISARIYPVGLETGEKTSWRAVWETIPQAAVDIIEPLLFYPNGTCFPWLALDRITYQHQALDHFVFTTGQDGKALSVSPKAFQVEVPRVII